MGRSERPTAAGCWPGVARGILRGFAFADMRETGAGRGLARHAIEKKVVFGPVAVENRGAQAIAISTPGVGDRHNR